MSTATSLVITNVDEATRAFADDPVLAFDLETSSLSPWDGTVAVVTLANKAGVAAVLHVRGHVPTLLKVWRFLESRDLLVGHNVVNFDRVWSRVHGMRTDRVAWFDTMVAEQALLPAGRQDFRANLAATLERRFKDDRNARKRGMAEHSWMSPTLSEEQVEYAAHDVLHLLELRDRQYEKAGSTALRDAIDLEMAILPAVSDMKYNGLPINVGAVNAMYNEKFDRAAALEAEIRGHFGRAVNMRSPKQVKDACHEVGLMVPNTTWETFRDLELRRPDHPLAAKIIEWKSNDQFMKMYRQEWLEKHVQEDGRVHASFWSLGTDTGRFSSSEPNLQQVPKTARVVYQAPLGWKIVAADYSQIEVRIAAAQAHDEALLGALDTDDVHAAVAAQMFSVSLESVTKSQRSVAKACVFTLLFAGSAERLYEYTRLHGGDLTLEDARVLFARFFATYSGLRTARAVAQQTSRRSALAITLPTGIKRVLVQGQSLTPQTVLNTAVQGTAAAGLKFALRRCVAGGLNEYLGATVHDELVACVPDAEAEEFGAALETAMLDGMAEVTDAPLRVEVKIGHAWS